MYNKEKQETINAKIADKREEKRRATTEEERFLNFKRDIIDGPNFPCFSCDRVLFKKQVKILKLGQIAKLFEKVNNPFLNNEVGINEGMIKIIFCHSCHKKITAKNL